MALASLDIILKARNETASGLQAATSDLMAAKARMEKAFAAGTPANAPELMAQVRQKEDYLGLVKRLSAESAASYNTQTEAINKMGDSLEKTSVKGGTFANSMTRGITRFVSLVYLIHAATAAMNAYSDAVDVGKSRTDTFLDVLKSLPLVGPLSTAGIRLIAHGAIKELEDRAKQNRMLYEGDEKKVALIKELNREISLAGASEAEKKRLNNLYEEEDLLKKIKGLYGGLSVASQAKLEEMFAPLVEKLAVNKAISERKIQRERENNVLREDRTAAMAAEISATQTGYDEKLALLRLKHKTEIDEYLNAGRDKTYLIMRQASDEKKLEREITNEMLNERTAFDKQRREEMRAVEEARINATETGSNKELSLLRIRHKRELDEYVTAGKDFTLLKERQSYEEAAVLKGKIVTEAFRLAPLIEGRMITRMPGVDTPRWADQLNKTETGSKQTLDTISKDIGKMVDRLPYIGVADLN